MLYGFCAFAIDKHSDEVATVLIEGEETAAFPMLNLQVLAPFLMRKMGRVCPKRSIMGETVKSGLRRG